MFEAPAMNLVDIRKRKLAMKRYKSDQYGGFSSKNTHELKRTGTTASSTAK